MARRSKIWFVVNTQEGFSFLQEKIRSFPDLSITYYEPSGFNLYVSVEGLDRSFAFENFHCWGVMSYSEELYFLKNKPNISCKEIQESDFLTRLKINEEIYYKVQSMY